MVDERRLYQAIGQKIRQLRETQQGSGVRMTQVELAEMVGLERTSITNIERGNQKVPLHVLFRICEALKAPISDVLPQVSEVQSSVEDIGMAEISFASETIETTPLVRQAVYAVLNRST